MYALPGWRPFVHCDTEGITFRPTPLQQTRHYDWHDIDRLELGPTTLALHTSDGETQTGIRHFGSFGQIGTAKERLAKAARQHGVAVT